MRLQPVSLVWCIVPFAIGCEGTDPSSIAGTYEATTFVFSRVGQVPFDVLAMGGSLSITIASDNSTTGNITLPEALVEGSDVSLSMAGTAVRSGNTVTFEQSADSFVREVIWQIAGNTLQGTLTNAGMTVDVTLTRQ